MIAFQPILVNSAAVSEIEIGFLYRTSEIFMETESRERGLLQGGNLVRHVLKKGGRNGNPLTIDDLDEQALQMRLNKLNTELRGQLIN